MFFISKRILLVGFVACLGKQPSFASFATQPNFRLQALDLDSSDGVCEGGSCTAEVDEEGIRAKYSELGQDQVFKFVDKLNANDRQTLFQQLRKINVAAAAADLKTAQAVKPKVSSDAQPLSHQTKLATSDKDVVEGWRKTGLKAVSEGSVGFFVVAGGQGTRLGTKDPKGMFDIGLPSHKSLFQLFAERLRKLQTLAAAEFKGPSIIPFYIMCSPHTCEKTKKFFDENKYFGLSESNVIFFSQGTLPCFDFDGKVMLESSGKVATAPNGNGGFYKALADSGVLEDLTARGVQYIHLSSVDNALLRVADPVFVGHCIEAGADVGAKIVAKASATEEVGVMVEDAEGRVGILEYSELSPELAAATTDSGELKLNAGNICNHFFTTEFLKRVAVLPMPAHIAKKKIPFADPVTGEKTAAEKKNGLKLELFIFDAFVHAKKLVALEITREDEFSPIKNADGGPADTPSIARKLLLGQHRRYLTEAGAEITGDGDVELAPMVSYAGEGLSAYKGRKFTSFPVHISDM